ncbi:MAG: phosphoribosylamine--glycine ligase [Flavobacteriales bacterium]|nr:phosphoribosylamine--glycine ligase [Flavobacteriales bacterium]
MNVLVLGSGGREHAVAWKLAQSSQLVNLYIAPGNPGTATVGVNVDLSVTDFDGIAKFAIENDIQIIYVGPEAPLMAGIHDYFEEREHLSSVTIIGPKKEGAMIEGSKDFSKAFMKRHNIPTAKYKSFTKDTLLQGYQHLEQSNPPYVLKADGLAAGKGVLIIDDITEAKRELKSMVSDGKFGDAGATVVIEQFLSGIEVSVFVITDGRSYKILPEAKDYKQIGEGDTGLMTGGMGAISPVPFANRDFMDKVDNQVIIPTIKGMRKEGIDYSGFIFFGLICVKGDPYVIEYNCRLGDPETEVIMPRLKSDLLELFDGIATGTLSERDVQIDPRTATTVMMVSGGYPGGYEKGKAIRGLTNVEDSIVFHAGTKSDGGIIKTNGGRVIAVTSYGKDIETALKKSYESVGKIQFDQSNFRKDIGFDLIKKPQKA